MLALPLAAHHSCVWCAGVIWMETKFCVAGLNHGLQELCELQTCLAGQACVLSDSDVILSQVLSMLSKSVLLDDHADIRKQKVLTYSPVFNQICAFYKFSPWYKTSSFPPVPNNSLVALGVYVLLTWCISIYKTDIQCLHLQLDSMWHLARGKKPLIQIMNKPCLCSVVDASISSVAEMACNHVNIWILHNSWNSKEIKSIIIQYINPSYTHIFGNVSVHIHLNTYMYVFIQLIIEVELLLFVACYLIKFLDWSRRNCSFICRIKIYLFKLSSLH